MQKNLAVLRIPEHLLPLWRAPSWRSHSLGVTHGRLFHQWPACFFGAPTMRSEVGFLGPDHPVAFAAGFLIVHFFRWIGLSNKIFKIFNYWLTALYFLDMDFILWYLDMIYSNSTNTKTLRVPVFVARTDCGLITGNCPPKIGYRKSSGSWLPFSALIVWPYIEGKSSMWPRPIRPCWNGRLTVEPCREVPR